MKRVSIQWRFPSASHIGAVVAILAAGFGSNAYGQDTSVEELKRKVAANESDNGFCASVDWAMTNPEGEKRFLDNAAVGTAEAARFASGLCSYTYVTQVYPGQNGNCVRYTWWSCGPGYKCAIGETAMCRNAAGGWTKQ